MPLFICDVCSGIDNTARGFADHKNHCTRWSNPELNGKAFCSECIPAEPDTDGNIYYMYTGKWHGEFPKEIATEDTVRERGHSTENRNGFIYFGRFEYLRPEIMKRVRLATRRWKAANKAKAQ